MLNEFPKCILKGHTLTIPSLFLEHKALKHSFKLYLHKGHFLFFNEAVFTWYYSFKTFISVALLQNKLI